VTDEGAPQALDRILPRLLDDLRVTFGPDLVGVYQYGSAVHGGFDPMLSDLDLVIVTEPPVESYDFDVLAGIVGRLKAREPDWADRLDLAFIGRMRLANFRAGGPLVSISHEESLHVVHDASDWLVTWFLVRDADRPLVGPSATSLVPPIEIREFLLCVALDVDHFVAAVRADQGSGSVAYRLLTLCRVLRSLESGALCTKQDGADWTAARFPEWAPVIQTAWHVRSSDGAREFSPEERLQVTTLLAHLAEQIRRTGPPSLPAFAPAGSARRGTSVRAR
jgi:hypothetical protein